jgi:hypothetical protein
MATNSIHNGPTKSKSKSNNNNNNNNNKGPIDFRTACCNELNRHELIVKVIILITRTTNRNTHRHTNDRKTIYCSDFIFKIDILKVLLMFLLFF